MLINELVDIVGIIYLFFFNILIVYYNYFYLVCCLKIFSNNLNIDLVCFFLVWDEEVSVVCRKWCCFGNYVFVLSSVYLFLYVLVLF